MRIRLLTFARLPCPKRATNPWEHVVHNGNDTTKRKSSGSVGCSTLTRSLSGERLLMNIAIPRTITRLTDNLRHTTNRLQDSESEVRWSPPIEVEVDVIGGENNTSSSTDSSDIDSMPRATSIGDRVFQANTGEGSDDGLPRLDVDDIVGINNTSTSSDESYIDPMSRVTLRNGRGGQNGQKVVRLYNTDDLSEDISASDSSDSEEEYESAEDIPNNVCPICAKILPTVIGVKIHIAAKHKEISNAAKGEGNRRKWYVEELRVLAKAEAQAIMQNVRFMNIHLHERFPERTLEAIKGQRRQAKYKVMVEECKASEKRRSSIVIARRSQGVVLDPVDVTVNEELAFEIRRECDTLEVSGGKAAELVQIARRVASGEVSPVGLMVWIKAMCPVGDQPKGPNVKKAKIPSGNAKQRRKQAYANIQELYKSDKKAALRTVLQEGAENVQHPGTSQMFEYWGGLMGRSGEQVTLPRIEESDGLKSLWYPVTMDEVKDTKVESTAAPGPDGIKPSRWNKVPVRFVQLLFNCFIQAGGIPDELSLARTIFIPKKDSGLLDPKDFRPITISSVIARHFHKILARRLQNNYDFDHRQRAFLPLDGTIENLSVLNAVMVDAKTRFKELHLASLDVAKAFDSVYFESITETLRAIGAPVGFVQYIKNLYDKSYTVLQFCGTERKVGVKRGVRQGDPLSPLLFNLVIERCIRSLNDSIGYEINGARINGLAYADDVILMAHTPAGLQANLSQFAESLGGFGLKLNAEKSGVVSVMPCNRGKGYLISEKPRFTLGTINIPQRGICEVWKYLGVIFSGATVMESKCSIFEDLTKLTAAPLKPQQRMLLLKQYLLPRYNHGLVLGRTTRNQLEKLDSHVRNFVRGWLKLPKDTPLGYFYTTVKEGGLGVPHLTFRIAKTKLNRLSKLASSDSSISRAAAGSPTVERQLNWCTNVLKALVEPTSKGINRYWRDRLYQSIDGADLSHIKDISPSCDWVRNTLAITGSDYVHFHQLRIDSMPSRARSNRGSSRVGPTNCRAGCNKTETAYHAIQQCFRTHGGRIIRHDKVCKAVGTYLRGKGHNIVYEPQLRTSVGLRKPDLLAIKNGECVVLDAQIVKGDNMDRDFRNKVAKYRDIPEMVRLLSAKYAITKVRYVAITLSYRGIWCQASYRALKELGISEQVLSGITKTALRGSWINWRRFNTLNTQIWGGR